MTIERGTYEVIRDRLSAHGRTLAEKAARLNARRIELFGGAEMALLGSDRIRTENNCVPRDIAEAGNLLLFGYNVFIGLKTETQVSDVFSLHRVEDFAPVPAGAAENFLRDESFVRDFRELYQYYRNSRLLQLRRVESKLLAVFQTGDKLTDIRVFRWNIAVDGKVTYIDNRGERDHVFPPRHDFEWTQTTREHHVAGKHPHVSIVDAVFVETVGGDVTFKIEDNTSTGRGVFSEPVDDPDQSLDDAQIHYAVCGTLILVKILPYREKSWRYYVFNKRTKSVRRIDAIGHACIQLPEDHGIIFPGGYYLRTGDVKIFEEHDPSEMELLRAVRAPNGEDVLYAFHRRDEGRTLLFAYNLIRKEVVNPISCHGYSLFDDGKMIIFSAATSEPTRVHPMQIWQTPFVSDDHLAKTPPPNTFLGKVGNRDLVRGLSSVLSISRLVDEQTPSRATYEDLVAATARVIDAYHWIGHSEAEDLLSTIKEVRATAELIIDEFEKVEALRAQAAQAVAEVEQSLAEKRPEPAAIDDYVAQLGELRSKQGHIISLRELRYVDRARLDALEAGVVARFDALSQRTVQFLLDAKALAPFADKTAAIEAKISAVTKTTEAEALVREVETVVGSLHLLTEIIGSLQIEDPALRIQILERISQLMSGLNRVRALVTQRRKELLGKERVAEFGVQFALFTQTVANAVSSADTPERCDTELSKLMLQLEELETRFSEFDDFVAQLGSKREEVYDALTARKQSLLEQRQRRAEQLAQAATRILQGITRRAATLGDVDALNAFFASDPMVAKLRSTSEKLRELGDIVRADEIDGKLKTSRDEASRSLRDRNELFEEGSNVVRFGEHRFSVNAQPVEVTIVPREGIPHLHITGTGFFEKIEEELPFPNQELVSESEEVYRAEYLAYVAGDGDVREVAASRYDEGYERGVHDHDAALIAEKLRAMRASAGLLRYTPSARAAAALFWAFFEDEKLKAQWSAHARALEGGRLARLSAAVPADDHARAGCPGAAGGTPALRGELQTVIEKWLPVDLGDIHGAGEYLFHEIAREPIRFVLSSEATEHLDINLGDLRTLDWPRRLAVVRSFVPNIEAAAAIVANGLLSRERSSAIISTKITGLLGQHPRVVNGTIELRLDEFLARLARFESERVPAFRAYQQQRHAILERERKRLRLSELQPKVMSAFVRNKLISEVYLPLIGANFAKQIGVAGEKKRTDLMGLLLLVSPPGYGKTTLLEYIAVRLGLVFVKINGPALGHSVKSLDPNEAPNATARQEIIKLNLALEMGNNVLLMIDDIQHTHAEFLQKFISLCDAQRKIEGVWRGEPRTYDLRGKRFAVCMAGNPYTESGEKFEIPDMLANRADVYNLGEVLAGRDELFDLSYIENALTANAITAPLLTRDPNDVQKLVRMARGEEVQADQLSHDYSSVELNELLSVLRKLVVVQQLLARVNRQYVLSAAQQNAYRTEPPFKLQGSYRNMSKLAEKVLPAMNDDELQRLIDDHYLGEAQTLTVGAEENLLKLAELRGRMTDTQRTRWEEIKRGYVRVQRLGGAGETDPAARVMAELSVVSDRIGEVARAIAGVSAPEAAPLPAPTPVIVSAPAGSSLDLTPYLAKLDETLHALRELHAARLPIAAAPVAPMQTPATAMSREVYLIQDTLIPLLRFMAHRFKSYRSVADPKVKQAIARLESVKDLDQLVSTLENISVSALASLTE